MSAAGYTNRVRTRSEARVTKVEYPQQIAANYNPLYSSVGCSPRFGILKYDLKPKCVNVVVCGPFIYYGDGAFLSYPNILNGQNVSNPPTTILNGGNSSY